MNEGDSEIQQTSLITNLIPQTTATPHLLATAITAASKRIQGIPQFVHASEGRGQPKFGCESGIPVTQAGCAESRTSPASAKPGSLSQT